MNRRIVFAVFAMCILCLSGCNFVDRNATYKVTVNYYFFMEDNETLYTVSCKDTYSTAYNKARGYDTSISMYALNCGPCRRLRETALLTSFDDETNGKIHVLALYKSEKMSNGDCSPLP